MYKPDVKEEKYNLYLEAFHPEVSMDQYLDLVTKFIVDPNMSVDDTTDLFFFKDVLFSTKFGKNHIFYYHWLCLNAPENYIYYLAKYSDFLDRLSYFFISDLWKFLILTHYNIVDDYFNFLSYSLKLKFLQMLKSQSFKNKELIVSKKNISLYMTFL